MTDTAETVRDRFEAAGLAVDRFVVVKDGDKMCVDHDTRYSDPSTTPGQNYGIYADEDDRVVILDVDYHREGSDDVSPVAMAALGALPHTLKMQSPHVPEGDRGGHRIYKLKGEETPAELFRRRFGRDNPIPSWGEVVAKNKYVVGAGSQLDGCDKDWCDRCAEPDGGRYEIKKDREIAEVDPETLIEALAADPDLDDKEAADSGTQTLDQVGGESGSEDDYEEFARETIEEMLAEVPGDQHFDDWIRTGYAVHDWDDSETGKEVFEEWSRANRKWDKEESQRQINYIWSGKKNRQGSKATVGTLVHLAKQHGWNPGRETPTPKELVVKYSDKYDDPSEVPDGLVDDGADVAEEAAEGQRETEREAPPDKSADAPPETDVEIAAPDWRDVRSLYEAAANEEGITKGSARKAAADALEEQTSWMFVLESERLWVYDEETGIYGKYGEAKAGATLKEELASHYSQTERREIIGHLEDGNQTHREELNARGHDAPLLCVGNGVINLETGDLMDHSPSFRFVRGLRWDYDPDRADRQPVIEFLDDVTERKADRNTLLDHLAHGLMPGHPYRAFTVCYGPGGNGKTQVSEVFRGFVGEENAAAVEIDELTDDDFATGDLPGKFINWGDDMAGDGGGTLEEVSLLKKATGGSKIRANEKFEKTFDFTNEAAMFFSANEPPRIGERKRSMQDRIYPIEMPFVFESDPDPDDPRQKQKIPNISDKLLENDAAMRGLLALAVEHAQRLIDTRGRYSQPESGEERLEKYNKSADPIVRFAGRAVESSDANAMIRKDDLYRVYSAFVEMWGERGASERGFKRQFPKAFPGEIETGRSRSLATYDDEKDRVRCFKRVTWTETAKLRMPEWMQERYADHFGDESDESDEMEETDEQKPLGAMEPQYGAEFVATVEAVSEGEYTRDEQGRLSGPHGTYIGYVVPGSSDVTLEGSEGDTLRLSSVTLRTNDDGLLEAVVDGAVGVEPVEVESSTADDTGGDSGASAAADGGTATADADAAEPPTDVATPKGQAKQQILGHLNYKSRGQKPMDVVAHVSQETDDDVTAEVVKDALNDLQESGEVVPVADGKIARGN